MLTKFVYAIDDRLSSVRDATTGRLMAAISNAKSVLALGLARAGVFVCVSQGVSHCVAGTVRASAEFASWLDALKKQPGSHELVAKLTQ